MAEAVEPEEFRQHDKERTVNWLFSKELITTNQQSALKNNLCEPRFRGVSDLLPFLEDNGLINLQAVLDEVAGGAVTTKFSLRSVARIKQEMREAAGIAEPAALATESVQPDMTEAEDKLQRVGNALREGGEVDKLAAIVSEEMSFHSDDSNKKKGVDFIRNLYSALEGDGDEEQNVRHARQLKIVGPSNNGKTELAQWMARMWVASANDQRNGGWIETYVTMETMDAHLWSARESTGSAPREIWGPLRYLFALAWKHENSRFALVLHESNRGGLFNALNRIWWEKRRNYDGPGDPPDDLMRNEHLPPNLALIFTENPKTADYATIGDGDEALLTRLTPKSTFALVRGGTDEAELMELGLKKEEVGRYFSTENVGLFYAMAKGGYSSDDWKHRLGSLANDTDVSHDDDVEFERFFGVAPEDFRKKVAGKQIEIIRDNPPTQDTQLQDSPGLPPAKIKNQRQIRHDKIYNALYAGGTGGNLKLAFVHADLANNQKEARKRWYRHVRQHVFDHHEGAATVAQILKITKEMPEALRSDNSNTNNNITRMSSMAQILSGWVGHGGVRTSLNGPSVKIVHNRSELTWDEFDRVRTAGGAGGNGQNATEPVAAAPAAPDNTPITSTPLRRGGSPVVGERESQRRRLI